MSSNFISGTHAISTAIFALLCPKDTILFITGKPYDTLDSVIGFNDNKSSLKSFGIKYEQIDLINDEFDYENIKKILINKKIKMIEIQRSIGYSKRKCISIENIEKVINYRNSLKSAVVTEDSGIIFVLKAGQNDTIPSLRADEFLKHLFEDSNLFKIKRTKFFDMNYRVI